MPDSAAPTHIDLATQLPADAYSQLIRTLRLALPPPLSDSPEDVAQRDHSAIARIAALAPANAVEADLAALFVAASDQGKECLRLACQPDVSAAWAMKCRAQANSMLRQAQSAMRLLLHMQAMRRKLEADTAASDRAAWTEHCAIGLMAEALVPRPEPEPATVAEPLMQGPVVEPDDETQPARIAFRPSQGDCGWPQSPRPPVEESLPPTRSSRSEPGEGATLSPEFRCGTPPSPLPLPPQARVERVSDCAPPERDSVAAEEGTSTRWQRAELPSSNSPQPRTVSRTAKRDSHETGAYPPFGEARCSVVDGVSP